AALVLASGPTESAPSAAPPGARPARLEVRDESAVFDANEIATPVSNLGWFAAYVNGGDLYQLEWPRGSGRHAMFAAGLWVGARVGPDTLVTVAEYTSEWAAGPMTSSGAALDPNETDPAHRVYAIRRCDTAERNPDYAQWPSVMGAPVDAAGRPLLFGDQTLWSVANDAVATDHSNSVGNTAPLGLELRQTVFGFARGGDLDRALFVKFDLHNRGAKTLDD